VEYRIGEQEIFNSKFLKNRTKNQNNYSIDFFSIRRFGSRTNKDVAAVPDEDQPSSIVRKTNTRPSSASNNLLNAIRERKRDQTDFIVHTNAERTEDNDDDDEEKNLNDEGLVLIRDLKDYLSAGASIHGKATTAEIIDHFQTRLNGKPGLVPKFKSLLKHIADLQRTPSGMAFWILKEEFQGT